MKEDNISQLGDYDAPFCEQQYTHGYCYISLFKFKSFDQFNTPQPASNFRHLLSCGTIEFDTKYHILHDFRASTSCKEKISSRSNDLHKLKLLTNFYVNLTSSEGVIN